MDRGHGIPSDSTGFKKQHQSWETPAEEVNHLNHHEGNVKSVFCRRYKSSHQTSASSSVSLCLSRHMVGLDGSTKQKVSVEKFILFQMLLAWFVCAKHLFMQIMKVGPSEWIVGVSFVLVSVRERNKQQWMTCNTQIWSCFEEKTPSKVLRLQRNWCGTS